MILVVTSVRVSLFVILVVCVRSCAGFSLCESLSVCVQVILVVSLCVRGRFFSLLLCAHIQVILVASVRAQVANSRRFWLLGARTTGDSRCLLLCECLCVRFLLCACVCVGNSRCFSVCVRAIPLVASVCIHTDDSRCFCSRAGG